MIIVYHKIHLIMYLLILYVINVIHYNNKEKIQNEDKNILMTFLMIHLMMDHLLLQDLREIIIILM